MNIHDLKAYEILEEREISDIHSYGYIIRHKKTGARISILSNDDNNKVFYIGFRTTPVDETGVPHIIEHTVLCGSKKFPVKDPFIELAKGSLNTFLNAMTYPDKTVYPIASCNDKDFKNLMDVYLDAVFNPNITSIEEIFKQEGWHYELESEDAPITLNGVVYNEMKGAYSSPEEVLNNHIYKSLFPDNTYSKDSGGNPVHIPELTYEYYLDFYRKYYHPSNSYIYLYGDMDIVERLEWLDQEYLCNYNDDKVDSEIVTQKPFDEVKDVVGEYSISEEDDEENQTYLSYNRVVGDSLDRVLYQAFDILEYALVSAPGAPVKQALIDAGIGEDVYGSFESGVKQPVFSIVAKNANLSQKDEFVRIIEETLKAEIAKGINSDSLLAAINSSEFKFREADFGQFPKGLLYGLQCLDSWIFDDMKPYIHLECLDTFAGLKEKIGTGYFEALIKEYILDNTHGATVSIIPKKGLNDKADAKLEQKLSDYKASLSSDEIAKLIKDTADLKAYQEEPSSDEDLRKLPMLTREDMTKDAIPLSMIEDEIASVKTIRHDVNTNGINYINMYFDASDIDAADLGYVGLLSAILSYVDTASYSFSELSNAINIYTGGISSGISVKPDLNNKGEVIVHYSVSIKVLNENLEKGLSLIDEIIHSSKFDNYKRLSEIVSQSKARLQVSLSSSGNSVAVMRSMAGFSKYGYYQEMVRGIEFYKFICQVEKLLKENPAEVSDKIRKLCDLIFAKNRLVISFTSNEELYAKSKDILANHVEKIKDFSELSSKTVVEFESKNEGFTDASQIQYVARTGDFTKAGFEYTGIFKLLRSILSYDYLWTNVRVLGGAYGCGAAFLRSGESYFSSYRDPNLRKTNDVYNKIPEYIRNFSPDERDMTKYIIGTFSSLDTPLNPEALGSRSMNAYFEGLTYEDLQKERQEILNANSADVRNMADVIEAVLNQNNLCVIGNESAIKNEADMFDDIHRLLDK